jgi:cytochrome P450
MAGGETSGSAMASIIYFLLKSSDAHRKLNEEAYADIDVASTTRLEYLMAVLKEGMRIFPTAPQGTPRISPDITVEGHYVPKGVSWSSMRGDEALVIDNHPDRILRLSMGCYP